MQRLSLFVVAVVFAAAAVECVPVVKDQLSLLCSAREHRRQAKESLEQNMLQYQVYMYEHENLTISYPECHLMIRALESFCKVNEHKVSNDEKEFLYMCSSYVAPMTHDLAKVDRSCGIFFDVVTNLYCPLDPCVQITFEANNAPNALCNMLAVEDVHMPPPQRLPDVVETVFPPLTCGEYAKGVRGACDKASNSSFESLCGSFPARFQREGCEAFVSRLADVFSPSAICDSYECKETSRAVMPMCQLVGLGENQPVKLQEYADYQLATNKTFVLETHAIGIKVLVATYGLGDACPKRRNNILKPISDVCNGKLECDLPNPQRAKFSPKVDPSEKCSTEFEVKYVCSDKLTVPVHDVFGGEDLPYESIKISCNGDFPQFAVNSGNRNLLPTGPDGGYGSLYDVPQDFRKPQHPRHNRTRVTFQSRTLGA
eukprot:c4754_g1_i1.p1 GENE.c4754_g1_i1~~c4754_g1_i1.p1  ORF type:complete len:443 (-),score=112.57 c4754_g1_i1:109-1395(-)